ncbi:MAG: bifunctional histidinol-phosphatase/imidazoleglycerol-phosphate dehydratase HisB [Cyclobacteriaceae bacterium]|nr:bifunctional histidinol-phosphatase/imidazoleglycerol-phosphate dehydratase HisB [Cyclobacteriaceae bacterium]
MKKVLFIDRDGTLITEPPDEQIDSLEKLEFYPGMLRWLSQLAEETDFELVMVTNQDGLGTERFPEENFWPAHNKLMKTLEGEGIHFTAVHIDRSFPNENQSTRKPGTGMLGKYFSSAYDLKNSWVIGDRITDVELARNLGCRAILINDGRLAAELEQKKLRDCCALITKSWKTIYEFLRKPERTAEVHRQTLETDIRIQINLDGSGQSHIETGIGFFDHMLDQLARHGMFNLTVKAKGDLYIDEHHTIEDTALALGEAFQKALGDKRGIGRYGFMLPMDDCLATVALDLGGRPWLKWEATFTREKIGDMPTEMFMHFFKSFTDTARCTLHIKAEGENEHHKIESIFKAFARTLKMAVKREGNQLPSTKGTL